MFLASWTMSLDGISQGNPGTRRLRGRKPGKRFSASMALQSVTGRAGLQEGDSLSSLPRPPRAPLEKQLILARAPASGQPGLPRPRACFKQEEGGGRRVWVTKLLLVLIYPKPSLPRVAFWRAASSLGRQCPPSTSAGHWLRQERRQAPGVNWKLLDAEARFGFSQNWHFQEPPVLGLPRWLRR